MDSHAQTDRPAPKDRGGLPAPPRRSKVTTACIRCRSRKVKCDGQRPTCSRCALSGGGTGPLPCHWDTADGRSAAQGAKRPYDLLLELGDDPSGQSLPRVDSTPLLSTPTNTLSQGSSHGDHASSNSARQAAWPSSPRGTRRPQNQVPQRDSCYGDTGRIIEHALGRRGRLRLLGTASVVPLASNIQNIASNDDDSDAVSQERSTDPFQSTPITRHTDLIFRPARPSRDDEADFELPRRSKADTLFHIYWKSFHPIFPTLEPTEAQNAYAKLWTDEDPAPPNQVFLCIVNMIFALASRVDVAVEPDSREETSARYCGRALELFNRRRVHAVFFASIQAALLIAEYLHTRYPEQCWMYTGTAISMAQSMGLQRLRAGHFASDPIALRLSQRVWQLCVAWDRILCMTYGRAAMISQREATAVQFFNQVATIDPDQSDTTEQAITAFLNKSVELYMALGRALEDFSTWDLEAPDNDTPSKSLGPLNCIAVDRALAHERSLSELEWSLPPVFAVPAVFSASSDVLQHRHAIVLHQRFLQSRIIILRPLLSYLVRMRKRPRESQQPTKTHALTYQTMVQCSVACVAAAREAIQTLCNYDPTADGHLTNTWWNNTLYLYNAAAVLVAARLCNQVINVAGRVEVDASLTLALQLFQRYEANGPWARHLHRLLQKLACAAQAALDMSANKMSETLDPGGGEGDGGHGNGLSSQDPIFIMPDDASFLEEDLGLDAMFYFGNDPFALLGEGTFGG